MCGVLLASAAEAAPLTAEEAERLALARPENAAIVTATLDAARGDLVAARTARNPVFQYEREGADGLGGDGSENLFRLQRAFDLSGRRSLTRRAAGAEVSAAEHDVVDARAMLRADVSARFYDVLAADARHAAALSYGSELAALEAATAARERAGDASRYDLGRVRQETALAPAALAEASAEAFAARQSLGALIGTQALSRYDGFTGQILPPKAGPVDQLVAQAEAAPRLGSLAAEAQAADYHKRAAGRIAPPVTLGAGVRTTDGETGETGVLFSVSVPLPLFDRNQGAYLRRAAEARSASARYELARDRIAADVATLAYRANTLREAALSYDAGALASAADLRRVARVSYEAGEIGVLEAIDALRAAYAAELKMIDLQRAARAAFIALQELLPEADQ